MRVGPFHYYLYLHDSTKFRCVRVCIGVVHNSGLFPAGHLSKNILATTGFGVFAYIVVESLLGRYCGRMGSSRCCVCSTVIHCTDYVDPRQVIQDRHGRRLWLIVGARGSALCIATAWLKPIMCR